MIVQIIYEYHKNINHKDFVVHADKVIMPKYREDAECQVQIVLSPDQNNLEYLRSRPAITLDNDVVLTVDLEYYNPEIIIT